MADLPPCLDRKLWSPEQWAASAEAWKKVIEGQKNACKPKAKGYIKGEKEEQSKR